MQTPNLRFGVKRTPKQQYLFMLAATQITGGNGFRQPGGIRRGGRNRTRLTGRDSP